MVWIAKEKKKKSIKKGNEVVGEIESLLCHKETKMKKNKGNKNWEGGNMQKKRTLDWSPTK